jgi:dipeptidyl aminopeptidase/acylaminoacyl peptidase
MKARLLVLFLFPFSLFAQKKPLDHTVYDSWQSIGERMISNDGKWVVYTVTPQEGDANLYIQSTTNLADKREIARGYNAVITEDSRFVVFRIKPLYAQTREARIKKKRPDEMPKDSIGMVELGKEGVLKVAKVKSYKTPEKGLGWVAYHKEREAVPARSAASPTQRTVDSLRKKLDSLSLLVTELKNRTAGNKDLTDADDEPSASAGSNEGSDLVVRNLLTGKDLVVKNAVDFAFNALGTKLVIEIARSPRDSASANAVLVYDLKKGKIDTVLKGGNDFRNFVWNEEGSRLAFVAERDTNTKALQKFYGLYTYTEGADSAVLALDKHSAGMQLGMTISENANLSFSKSGKRLLFGTAPLSVAKDTTLVDIDLVKLDVWHYNDDYLQTQQLFQLNNELRRSYLAVYDLGKRQMVQLGSKGLPTVMPTVEGDGDFFVAMTDTGRRVASQWLGGGRRDVYAVNTASGALTLVKKNLEGNVYTSPAGRYILLYDNKTKNYHAWDGKGLKNITAGIKVPLYNEENDVPDDPNPYGVMGWHEGDSAVYVYDRYDVWKVDPKGITQPENVSFYGRSRKISFRYLRPNPDERFLKYGQELFFRRFSETTKASMIERRKLLEDFDPIRNSDVLENVTITNFTKAKNADKYLISKESFDLSPFLVLGCCDTSHFVRDANENSYHSTRTQKILVQTNRQQKEYNWLTAELYKWKTFDGKPATGILYKPENFDPKKKYPMLIYFYEKLSDGLYSYQAPAPTPSRLNIPFFVSRGYLVFAPDISYTKGHPGKDAYNYIVSGAQALAKNTWVDAKNIGIQGQSWGGYQVAHLITRTPMFKAAWAGAPVVNMFSAYGGIRWESGVNRQFQYEKGQSRIGATPWERPDLYIENSPFFHLKNVTTPLVIMANDADGAVPWYQGIEFFTALRRLGKKVWMLNYNGEAHNLVERKNRKDIQIREQQYFDWLLKGAPAPAWIMEGVPAVKKGKSWGLE